MSDLYYTENSNIRAQMKSEKERFALIQSYLTATPLGVTDDAIYLHCR